MMTATAKGVCLISLLARQKEAIHLKDCKEFAKMNRLTETVTLSSAIQTWVTDEANRTAFW